MSSWQVAHAIPVRLYPPDAQHSGWHYDDAELVAAFAQRPKLLLLNTPHNPTGKVFSAHELQRIAELLPDLRCHRRRRRSLRPAGLRPAPAHPPRQPTRHVGAHLDRQQHRQNL
jgi:hypothetical protein